MVRADCLPHLPGQPLPLLLSLEEIRWRRGMQSKWEENTSAIPAHKVSVEVTAPPSIPSLTCPRRHPSPFMLTSSLTTLAKRQLATYNHLSPINKSAALALPRPQSTSGYQLPPPPSQQPCWQCPLVKPTSQSTSRKKKLIYPYMW